jgi:hypothetical protein
MQKNMNKPLHALQGAFKDKKQGTPEKLVYSFNALEVLR